MKVVKRMRGLMKSGPDTVKMGMISWGPGTDLAKS